MDAGTGCPAFLHPATSMRRHSKCQYKRDLLMIGICERIILPQTNQSAGDHSVAKKKDGDIPKTT
jgi:hypothetical protein